MINEQTEKPILELYEQLIEPYRSEAIANHNNRQGIYLSQTTAKNAYSTDDGLSTFQFMVAYDGIRKYY